LISVRARRGVIELFNLPISCLHELMQNESPSKLKLRLELNQKSLWTMNDLPVEERELNTILRSLLKDLVVRSKGDFELVPEALRFPLTPDGQSLAGSVKDLVLEKNTLVQKVVTQQEVIQNRIAREIHDAVISNIGRLKRAISGDAKLSEAQMLKLLDETANRLREICHDLTPFLTEWGLHVVLEDLMERLGEHTGANSKFICHGELPQFPDEVQLHIFRIAQECVNNIEKYAEASNVTLSITVEDRLFTMTVRDDGRGFDPAGQPAPAREGGRGTGIMKERAELISSYFPAQLFVDSKPNAGTRTTLQIHLSM